MADNGHSRQRWYMLGLGSVIVLVAYGMANTCMPVLFSEIAAELNLNIVQIGTVWGLGSVASIPSILMVGVVADRFGVRRTMFITCLLAGTFGALRGLSDSFLTLMITTLLFGFATEAVPVVFIKAISLWFHGRGLGTAQGIGSAFVGGGMMLGALLSATVLSPLLGGWQYVLFLYGGISVLVGLLWFLTVPDPAPSAAAASGQSTPQRALGHVIRTRGVWLVALGMMGFAGSSRGLVGYLPLYLRNSGWTPAGADGALAALNAAGTVGAIPLSLASDRLGSRKTILLPGVIIAAISIGLLSVVTGPAAWLLAILAGLFRDMIWAVAGTLTIETEEIGPMYAGTAVGIVHAFARVGYAFSPPVGNSLVAINAGLPFVFWAGLAAAALLAFSLVKETGLGRQHRAAV
ncbi:MAG TPA: MFS transporter [Dehalococcoidales bacterium]|nr:MFS transporter [Dehalococcoidales bacterium]